MTKRIVVWHIPRPGWPLPSFYMERDYVPEKLRIYAEDAPNGKDFEVDIRDDGTTIFANRAPSHHKMTTVYSQISYNTLAVSTFATGNPGERISGGTSGAKGWVITDKDGVMELILDGTTEFSAGETITGGTSGATAKVLSFYRGGYYDELSDDPTKTTALLPEGQSLEERAEDLPESITPIAEGSVLTCHVEEMAGAQNVTIQLELVSLKDEELD